MIYTFIPLIPRLKKVSEQCSLLRLYWRHYRHLLVPCGGEHNNIFDGEPSLYKFIYSQSKNQVLCRISPKYWSYHQSWKNYLQGREEYKSDGGPIVAFI